MRASSQTSRLQTAALRLRRNNITTKQCDLVNPRNNTSDFNVTQFINSC